MARAAGHKCRTDTHLCGHAAVVGAEYHLGPIRRRSIGAAVAAAGGPLAVHGQQAGLVRLFEVVLRTLVCAQAGGVRGREAGWLAGW
jgi:hypothetical protein